MDVSGLTSTKKERRNDMCPRCGKHESVTAIHDMTKIHICSKCGEAWTTQIRGDTRYLNEILVDFGFVAESLTVFAGKRKVKLAAIPVEEKERASILPQDF